MLYFVAPVIGSHQELFPVSTPGPKQLNPAVVTLSLIFTFANEKISDEINKDNDNNWKLGSLYYNKNDPAVFVEKRFGIGWTLNWARWQSWMFIVVILGIVVASLILGF